MNPRAVVIALLTMITAVTGYTVVSSIAQVPVDSSSIGSVSVQGR